MPAVISNQQMSGNRGYTQPQQKREPLFKKDNVPNSPVGYNKNVSNDPDGLDDYLTSLGTTKPTKQFPVKEAPAAQPAGAGNRSGRRRWGFQKTSDLFDSMDDFGDLDTKKIGGVGMQKKAAPVLKKKPSFDWDDDDDDLFG